MIQMNNLSEKIDPKGTIYLKNDSNVTVYQWKIMQMNISLLKIDPNEQFSSENWSTLKVSSVKIDPNKQFISENGSNQR